MITQKVIDVAEHANVTYLKERQIYTADEVNYGYTQRVMQVTLDEAIEAVDRANLSEKSHTTYDEQLLEFCREQVKKEIHSLIASIRPDRYGYKPK